MGEVFALWISFFTIHDRMNICISNIWNLRNLIEIKQTPIDERIMHKGLKIKIMENFQSMIQKSLILDPLVLNLWVKKCESKIIVAEIRSTVIRKYCSDSGNNGGEVKNGTSIIAITLSLLVRSTCMTFSQVDLKLPSIPLTSIALTSMRVNLNGTWECTYFSQWFFFFFFNLSKICFIKTGCFLKLAFTKRRVHM